MPSNTPTPPRQRCTCTTGSRTSGCRSAIADRGPRRWSGWPAGATGMRERVRIFGGELHTGRRVGGGFEVRARIPVDGWAEHA